MLNWISNNLATIIISLVILGVVAKIISGMIKDKRSGNGGCGSGCSGCSGCGSANSCSAPDNMKNN